MTTPQAETKPKEKPKRTRRPKTIKAKPKNKMFQEVDRTLDQIARDKGISKERLIEAIEHHGNRLIAGFEQSPELSTLHVIGDVRRTMR